MKSTLLLVLTFVAQFSLAQDLGLKEKIYETLISKIEDSIIKSDEGYLLALSTQFRFPSKMSAEGFINSNIHEHKDSLDANLTNRIKHRDTIYSCQNFYEIRKLKEYRGQEVLYIMAPLDYWINFYHTSFRRETNRAVEFQKIFIPVVYVTSVLDESATHRFFMATVEIKFDGTLKVNLKQL